jgi:NAD(P)-dependent dehydrogenase (short-subunit alcohol dehydrogenase family)
MTMLEGRVAIVTGAGSGIGRATALRLAADGASVLVADINPDGAAETVALVQAAGGRAVAQQADVADEASAKAMVDAAIDAFGRLDGLHNNAANVFVVPQDTDIVNMDVAVWDASMATNVRGPMLGCKYAIPQMLKTGGGSIVNTSSNSGQMGDLLRVAYGVSKAGVDSLTRYVATMYGKQGIRCNAISPGVVATPALVNNVSAEELAMFEAHHVTPFIGTPDDIAAVVAFLLGEDARFITGQVIHVDGGMQMHTPLYQQMNAAMGGRG